MHMYGSDIDANKLIGVGDEKREPALEDFASGLLTHALS